MTKHIHEPVSRIRWPMNGQMQYHFFSQWKLSIANSIKDWVIQKTAYIYINAANDVITAKTMNKSQIITYCTIMFQHIYNYIHLMDREENSGENVNSKTHQHTHIFYKTYLSTIFFLRYIKRLSLDCSVSKSQHILYIQIFSYKIYFKIEISRAKKLKKQKHTVTKCQWLET